MLLLLETHLEFFAFVRVFNMFLSIEDRSYSISGRIMLPKPMLLISMLSIMYFSAVRWVTSVSWRNVMVVRNKVLQN